MCPLKYYTMTRSKNHLFDLRLHLVRYAIEHGIRKACAALGCSRNTVRLWLRRFRAEGPPGLINRRRAPKTCPHKTPPEIEELVIQQRKRTPGFGARRLKLEFELKPSVGAIARILREHGLTKRPKRKHQVKRDLRAIKAQYRPFTHIQMDVKYLNDIPNYLPQMERLGLPKFQYTARCQKTGAVFLAYGSEISLTYAELTARRLLEHLRRYGIDMTEVVIQTDSGAEFDGQAVRKTDRGFTHTVERQFGAHHRILFRPNPNANADVESFHSHEEREFFDIERFKNRAEFWAKITTYQNYWNLARRNSYKQNMSPLDILIRDSPHMSPKFSSFPRSI